MMNPERKEAVPLAKPDIMTESTHTPPTIIVVHPKEKRSKCSVEPLRGRDGFLFWTFPRHGPESLAGYVRLGLGGPLLTPDDRDRGLLILDGTWKLVQPMEAEFSDIPIRSLLPWRTAYPRVSKLYDDPTSGLATIEALFAAYVQTGRPTDGLLDEYHWRDRFLELNRDLLDGHR
jgi:pre-rRNA-processing protein TSR3